MKILKIFIAIILSALLLVTTGMVMSSFTISKAVSEDAIEEAITKTGAVEELTDRIIAQRTVNMGGRYGNTMQTILKSQAMTNFFTAYTARALQSQVLGIECDEIGSDELNRAFSQGTDECLENGSITMGPNEKMIFDQALNAAMPVLTEGINYVLTQMNLTSFVDEDTAQYMETAQQLTSDRFRYGTIGLSILICLLLIFLFWRRRTGLMWCAVCTLIVAAIFMVLSIMLDGTMESSATQVALSTRMMYVMVAYGAGYVAKAGGVAGAAMMVACGLFRLTARK